MVSLLLLLVIVISLEAPFHHAIFYYLVDDVDGGMNKAQGRTLTQGATLWRIGKGERESQRSSNIYFPCTNEHYSGFH